MKAKATSLLDGFLENQVEYLNSAATKIKENNSLSLSISESYHYYTGANGKAKVTLLPGNTKPNLRELVHKDCCPLWPEGTCVCP